MSIATQKFCLLSFPTKSLSWWSVEEKKLAHFLDNFDSSLITFKSFQKKNFCSAPLFRLFSATIFLTRSFLARGQLFSAFYNTDKHLFCLRIFFLPAKMIDCASFPFWLPSSKTQGVTRNPVPIFRPLKILTYFGSNEEVFTLTYSWHYCTILEEKFSLLDGSIEMTVCDKRFLISVLHFDRARHLFCHLTKKQEWQKIKAKNVDFSVIKTSLALSLSPT